MAHRHSSDGWWGLVISLGALVVMLLGLRGCDAWQCSEVEATTGRSTQWRLISGCYVEVDGRWIPRDSWRGEQELGRRP